MTVEEVLAEGETWMEYDTPAVLSLYALYRTMRDQANAFEAQLAQARQGGGSYWQNIALDLTHQNQVLCEHNRRLAEENIALRGHG